MEILKTNLLNINQILQKKLIVFAEKKNKALNTFVLPIKQTSTAYYLV